MGVYAKSCSWDIMEKNINIMRIHTYKNPAEIFLSKGVEMHPAPIILCPPLHHPLRLWQVNCLPFNLHVFSLPLSLSPSVFLGIHLSLFPP